MIIIFFECRRWLARIGIATIAATIQIWPVSSLRRQGGNLTFTTRSCAAVSVVRRAAVVPVPSRHFRMLSRRRAAQLLFSWEAEREREHLAFRRVSDEARGGHAFLWRAVLFSYFLCLLWVLGGLGFFRQGAGA